MAVKGTTEDNTDTTTRAPGIEAPQPMRAPGPGFGTSGGNALFDIINTLGGATSLGGAIEEYLKTIKSYFVSDTTSTDHIKIDVVRLTEPNGAHAFVADKKAIVMLFTETLPADTQNYTPSSDYANYAVRALRAKFGEDVKLVNVVVVLPQDYSRAQLMAQYIHVSLTVATSRKLLNDTTIGILGDNQYSIDPDVVAARNYINQLNPSSVSPRMDIGFVIYAKSPRRSGMQLGPLEDMRPIAAVGGYTEMLISKDQSGMIKYLPMVHVTTIASAIPLPGIVPLCVTIAADQFVSTGRWIQQFSSFQKGKPNLGQLSRDPADDKKLWFATDPQTLDTWRVQNCLPAVLAIDVAEGTARIPALAAYGYLPHANAVYDQIQSFFGSRITMDRTQAPYLVHATDFIGVYGSGAGGGTLIDSRNMDYMTLLADGALDSSSQVLLQYPLDPTVRARVISEKTAGSFRALYRTTISVLSPNLLSTLAMAVQQTLQIDAPQGQNRMSQTDWMRAQSALYQAQNFSVTRTEARGGYNLGGFYNV